MTPEKFQRHLKPRLPPFDSPVGSEEQVADLFAKEVLRSQASSSSIKQLASKLGKRLVELDTFKKKVQTPKTLQRISFLERDLDRLNAEMWNVSNHDKTRRTSPRELFNMFRLARGRPQPIQFAQTPTLEYKGDHHSDSDAANETQLATTDHEKIEMIKKVKFRNNDNPKSKRILDESGARHDPQREDINMPRDIDAEKLRTIIRGLQNNKAPGPYQVPNEAIKLGMELLLPYFLLGFRACLNLSLHPTNFKDSIIVMLLKAGEEVDKPESYRPISLLSTVSKLCERILADMMLDVLKENPHFLLATQFGNKTTTEALQYLFRIIYGTWCSRSNDVVTILGLDMSSAYDNFYRQKLLQTLYDKDFPKWFVDIIGRVLSLRDATLRLPGIISERFGMNTGIPQGLPLSTVLFSLFLLS
ncbi:hypothetical protein AU210_004785 [Fusarium oxysporum f. sp. radicis-cucumerinum]|uniref:Reverse transcriptase domain-containing protein n=1 Tax=Fusarium oxysporum f. sp. radicis-cucumerinum TaxID=327505 RepID=A0A2H3HH84_FUSOX|nr:hypothetical protein AU210_004785 [Fusarium oxysporum f. sp. radicis-cucumerinum]